MNRFSLSLPSSLFGLALLATGAPAASPLIAAETQRDAGAGVETWLFDPVDAVRERAVPVKVFRNEDEAPQPVVVFSHGLGGSRENNSYLGEHWAAAGYTAVFVQHPGSDESVWRDAPLVRRMAAMREAANATAWRDRIDDVPFVLDRLEEWNADPEHPLHARLDLSRIGMSGHSFGARTTQALMGQSFPGGLSFAEPRLSAFLLLSPSIPGRRDPATAFGSVEAPVLCMTGTLDDSPLDPSTTPESRLEVYRALPQGDKYELLLEGAHHFAFGDGPVLDRGERLPHHHPAILALSTRFWDAYLKGDGEARAWLRSDRAASESGLAAEDRWQWK